MPSEGQKRIDALRLGGFSESEVQQWRSDAISALRQGGYSQSEIKDYFGVKEPDMKPAREFFQNNIQEAYKSEEGEAPKGAKDLLDAWQAGWQTSVTGLLVTNRDKPNVVLEENASTLQQIVSGVAQVAGDLPGMLAGGIAWGAAGTAAAPGVGTTIAAGAGAFAFPAAVRKIMMDMYQEGSVQSAGEFVNRLMSTSWEIGKAAVVGGATAGTGVAVKVGAKALKLGSKATTTAEMTSELATLTTLSSAIEGELPEPHDFVVNAALIGGFRGTTHIGKKLMKKYAETGKRPEEIETESRSDPKLKEELSSDIKPEIKGEKTEFKDGSKKFSTIDEKADTSIELPKTEVEVSKGEYNLRNPEHKRTEAEMAMLNTVGEQPVLKDPVKFIDKFTTAILDDLHPIFEAVKLLSIGEGELAGYKLARVYRGWHNKYENAIKGSTYDFATGEKRTGDGLFTIFERVPDGDIDGALAYMIAKRAKEKSQQTVKKGGKEVKVKVTQDLKMAEEVIKNGKKFEHFSKELTAFQNRMMKYAVDAELLTPEAAIAFMKRNQFYIPFHKVLEIDPLTGKPLKSKSIFKTMFGSHGKLTDPINNIYKNTAAIIRAAERNRAEKALVDLANKRRAEFERALNKKLPDAELKPLYEKAKAADQLIRKSETKMKPIVATKEMKAKLEKEGIDPDSINGDLLIFRPRDQILKPNQIMVFEKGKPVVYDINPRLHEAIKAMDIHPGMTGLLFDVLFRMPAKALRFGVTIVPEFIIKNTFRDPFVAFMQTRAGQIPFWDTVKAMKVLFKRSGREYELFLQSGGASGSQASVFRYIKEDPWTLNKKTGWMDKTLNVVKSPFEALALASQISENLSRFAEAKRKGFGIEGGFAAREVTLDFAKMGAKVRALNSITPFLAVGIQGIHRVGAQIKAKPVETISKGIASITLPSVLLWWANKDDSRYKNAPSYQKDLFWLIPTDKWEEAKHPGDLNRESDLIRKRNGKWEVNNGTMYKIPKPFEYGLLFGSSVERTLQAFHDKSPKAFKGFDSTIKGALIPNVIPASTLPFVEHAFNESLFTKRPLVANHLQHILPDYQFTDYTSETAKALGKMIKHTPFANLGTKEAKLSSPVVIDNYIRSWGGSLGQYILDMSDQALVKLGVADSSFERPADSIADIPFVKAFIMRYPVFSAEPIKEFYENYDRTKKVRTTIKRLLKDGRQEEAAELTRGRPEDMIKLDGSRKAISNLNKIIHNIYINPKMNKHEKRQLIESVYYQMIEVARSSNVMVDKIKEGHEARK